MWNYLLRRLLIMAPTLFGVTIVSFLIMQLAPGDPLMNQMGGMSSASGQTREAYLIQKRDLHLDKPIVLNFNYFRDYSQDMRIAAHYMSRSPEEIAEELSALVREPRDAKLQARYDFLRRMEIDGFDAACSSLNNTPAWPRRCKRTCNRCFAKMKARTPFLRRSPCSNLQRAICRRKSAPSGR